MTDVAPEYQDRVNELDQASSPTIRLSITPQGTDPTQPAQGQPGQSEEQLTVERTKQLLHELQTPKAATTADKELQFVTEQQRAAKEPPPETQQVLQTPEWRRVLDAVLSTFTGLKSKEIQHAIETGTLGEKINLQTVGKTLDPFGNAASTLAERQARESGLPPEVASQIAGAAGFFASMLFPGFKGSKAGREVAAAAGVAREAATTEQVVQRARRLVRVTEATTEQAKVLAGESGDLVVGQRAIKIDFTNVDSTGDVDRILNRVAEVVHDQFVDAKRGVISDPQLAEMAKESGIDITQLLARKRGEVFNVEKQMAAQMAAGSLGLRVKQLSQQLETLPAGVTDPTLEEELRRTAMLLLSVVPQMRASTSEAARVLRIAGTKVPGAQHALRQEEMLRIISTREGELASGLPMRDLARQLATLDTPEQVVSYFRILRALVGGAIGGGLGAEAGGAQGGTGGAIAGGAVGAVGGAAIAVNPAILMEAWINGLLSGTLTYVVNITTEMASSVNGTIERALAATHGSMGVADHVVGGEAMVMVHAGISYMWRSLLAYAKTLASEPGWTAARAVTGAAAGAAISTDESLVPNAAMGAAIGAAVRPGSFLTPDMALRQRALSAEGLGLSGPLGRFADVTGALLRAPSRGLVKADEWIKAMNVEMELWAQAHRKAILSGAEVGSPEYKRIVTDALREPGIDTIQRAQDYAAYIAFQSETNRAIAGVTAGNPILRIISPFTFTPANILSMSFERMPLIQYASSQLRADLNAGGARAQLARAKIDNGIALTAFAWYLAAAGVTNGHGSVNPELAKFEREVLKRQPYSFNIPGTDRTNISFNRFDPWAMHFGLVATVYQMSHELPESDWKTLLGAVIVAGADQWLNKSYMQGISQFTDAFTEGRRGNFRALDKWVEGLAASTVPTGVATLERAVDPKMREADGAVEAILNRLPIFSDAQPARHDFFGEYIMTPHVGWEVLDMLNPFYVQQETMDEKARYIVKEFRAKQMSITGPSRTVGGGPAEQSIELQQSVGPHAVKIPDDQFEELKVLFGKRVRVNGETLKDALYSAMHSGVYQSLGPIGQRSYITALVAQFKHEALMALRRKYPVLDAKIKQAEQQRMKLTTTPQAGPLPAVLAPSLGR